MHITYLIDPKSPFRCAFSIIYITTLLTFCLIFTFDNDARSWLINLFDIILNQSYKGYATLILAGTLVMMSGIPYTLFELALGFGIKNLPLALTLNSIQLVIGTTVTFVISRFFLKNLVHTSLQSNSTYQKLQYFVKTDQLKHIFFLRVCYVPLFIKNYMIPTLDVKFSRYMIASLFSEFLTSLYMIIAGNYSRNLSSLEKPEHIKPFNILLFLGVGIGFSIAVAKYISNYSTDQQDKQFDSTDTQPSSFELQYQ